MIKAKPIILKSVDKNTRDKIFPTPYMAYTWLKDNNYNVPDYDQFNVNMTFTNKDNSYTVKYF